MSEVQRNEAARMAMPLTGEQRLARENQSLRDERDRLLVVAAKFIKLAEWCADLGWREFYYDDTTGLDGIIDLSDTFNPKLHADIELLRAALTPAGGGQDENK